MDVRILGSLEVEGAEGPIALPGGRAPALLAMLAINAGTVVSSDRLIDELWASSPPATSRTKLQGLVSSLRKRLEPARRAGEEPSILLTSSPGYLLAVATDRVDAHRFRRLVREAEGLPPVEKAETLRVALGLWRGPALADFTYEPFAQAEISALDGVRLQALQKRIEADLALHRHQELIPELEELVDAYPFREGFRGQLMLAYYRSGRQADALRLYHETQKTLREELGVDPGRSLQELEQAILHQDPQLDLQPLPAHVGAEADAPVERWLVEGRKTVTVVLTEFLTNESRSDPERTHLAVRKARLAATELLEAYGGLVQGSIGGVLLTVFGVPHAHEDDAMRAARACVRLHQEVARIDPNGSTRPSTAMAARSGINTGEVIVGDPAVQESGISGNAVTAASALQREAQPGQVLIGETTRQLLGDAVLAVPVEPSIIDGRGRTIGAWILQGVIPGARPLQPRPDSPMVGRDAEIEWLERCLRRATDEETPELAVVVGDAGIGKTRLAMEFTSKLDPEITVLTGHCQAFGEGTTLWPIQEIVAEAAGGLDRETIKRAMGSIDQAEPVAKRLAGLFEPEASDARMSALFPTIRSFLTAMASDRTVVVIFEDVHWAQQTLLDLVEYLATSIERNVLFLCLARPEFADMRSAWLEADGIADSLYMQPLDDDRVEELLAQLSAGRPLTTETRHRLIELAQGNPLFVNQMLAALRDDSNITIPATVQALLSARLDRLGPAERDVIRVASVLGAGFTLQLLMALLPEEARPSTQRHLQRLTDKKLVVPREGDAAQAEDYRFGHALIRLAAYRSITKERRAHLHERVAALIDQGEATRDADVDQLVGFHLEQAFRYRDELGDAGQDAATLAVRAGKRLARAGLSAFARFDAEAAEDLLARARELLPPDHSDMSEVKRQLAEAHQTMGHHEDALEVISELLDRPQEDVQLEHALRLERVRTRLATGSDEIRLDGIAEEALRAQRVLQEAGDHAGLAQAWFTLAEVEQQRGNVLEMERLARQALDSANASGNTRYALGAMRLVATSLLIGPVPVSEAIEKCEDLTWRGQRNAAVLPVLGQLHAMAGEFEMAREMIGQARTILIETARARRPLSLVGRRAADVEILAGDLLSAERELRKTLDLDLEMHLREETSLIASMLSTVLIEQDRFDDAEPLIDISHENAPRWSVVAQTTAAAAQARLMAGRGEFEKAETLATTAVDSTPDEMPGLRADRLADLGQVLIASGRSEAAARALENAARLYSQKGNVAALHRVRERIPAPS